MGIFFLFFLGCAVVVGQHALYKFAKHTEIDLPVISAFCALEHRDNGGES